LSAYSKPQQAKKLLRLEEQNLRPHRRQFPPISGSNSSQGEAIVVRVDDGEFLVRWRDDPKEPRATQSSRQVKALAHVRGGLSNMNDRFRLQLKLQQAVKIVSIGAITYYLVAILHLIFEGAHREIDVFDPVVATAISVPFVLALSRKLARAAQLLRTRVEIELESQSRRTFELHASAAAAGALACRR
jgi:Protein of unknown function (DUF3422)